MYAHSTSAVTADDSTLLALHGSVDDKPTKLIASARGRWRDFLRRPRERPASPPLIDAPDDLTKATESMNVAPLLLVFHPSCFLMHVQKGQIFFLR